MVTEGRGDGAMVTTGRNIGLALKRAWWVIVLALMAAFVVGLVVSPVPGYTTSLRATVLIPGDTEDTGSAERPELMVLDDLGPFIESRAFAEAVAAQMDDDVQTAEVDGMLAGSRYSRIATVDITGDDREFVLSVAEAAADALPGSVNDYLVALGSPAASVQVIDPPRPPGRDRRTRWIRIGAVTLLGGAAAAVVVVLLAPDRRRFDESLPSE